MDIAPLGFAIDTSGLDKGKQAAEAFTKSSAAAGVATEKLTQASIAAAKAESVAADQASRTANAKLILARQTAGVTDATLKEAKATADAAAASAAAARAKFELAKAGEQVSDSMETTARTSAVVRGMMQGVSAEAARLAANMGLRGGAGGQLGLAGAMGAAQGAAARLSPQLLALGGLTGKLGLGVGALAVGYVTLSASLADNQDRWASYQQQLVNSLGSQSAAQESLLEVVDLANEVGVTVDSALTSFNRFARAKDSIGATNDELLQMTEIIMKIGRSSGVEAGAMQGAMMQLSQALGSGRLNGDELRSIMENMQPLAKAIADGLGVSVGQLRKMGAEGELTGEKIFRALLGQGQKAEEMFASMPKTVEQSRTRMANQFDELGAHIGKMINATGVMQKLIGGMTAPIEAINQAFRKASEDGMKMAESRTEAMANNVDRVLTKSKTFLAEFNKQYNKDTVKEDQLRKDREEAEANLANNRKSLADAELLERAALSRIRQSRDEILRMQAMRASLGLKGGAESEMSRLGGKSLLEARNQQVELNKQIADYERGIAEIKRQQDALGRSDAFEKIVAQAQDLEEAFAKGGVTMADTWMQAIDIARATGKSIDEVIAALQRLQAAQRALADAKELRDITNQLQELQGVIGTIGAGSYAERLSRQQSGIAAWQADRAALGAAPMAAGGTGAGRVGATALADAIRYVESRNRDYYANGAPVRNTETGALYSMQVLPSTAARPGYGIAPARSATPEEYNRVGRELAAALLQKFGGNAANAAAAYHSGPGNVGNLGPRGRQYVTDVLARLGVSGGGAGGAPDQTNAIIAGRNNVFNAQEQERALRMISGIDLGRTDNVSRIKALAEGGPEAVRQLELELKVLEQTQEVAPEYRQMVADAIRDADAAERRLKAEQQIYDLRVANDNQERRNAAAATGDPAKMRALELQLRIEQIRRDTPEAQQGALIAQARREDALTNSGALAKRQGDLANQRRLMDQQLQLVGKIGDEERVQAKLLEEQNGLYQAGIVLTGDELANHLAMVEALERHAIELEKVMARWKLIRDVGKDTADAVGRAFSDSFGSAMRTGDAKWKDLMGSIEEAFYSALDRMVAELVISPIMGFLQQGLTMGLNALFGTSGSGSPIFTPSNPGVPAANGGVFAGPVTPFAAGSVFNTPTRFGFRGGTGLAGEGGYEGLFPLRRGPDGRLGIAASGGGGGGTQVNIYDQRSAANSDDIEVQERESGNGQKQIDVLVRDSVKAHFRRGSFDNDQRANYGVPRAVTRR